MAKIGEVGVDTPGGVQKLPVFEEGDSGSSVYEMVKVETPSGIGFVPMVENSADAAFPYIKVQTANHGVVHANDAATLKTVIDSFEDQNITEYNLDTGEFSISSNQAHDGTYSLTHDTNSDAIDEIYSLSGLDNYPAKGNEFNYWYYSDSSTTWDSPDNPGIAFRFGLEDHDDSYQVKLFPELDRYDLETEVNGSVTDLLDNVNVTLGDDSWIKINVVWDDGTLGGADNDITVTVTGSDGGTGSGTANNSDHASATGIGYQASDSLGKRIYIDDVYIV